jgi:hypothetical protein
LINDSLLGIQNNPVITHRFYFSTAGINCAIICQDRQFLDFLWKHYSSFETKSQPEYEFVVHIQADNFTFPKEENSSSSPAVKRMGKWNNFIIRGPSYVALANTSNHKVLVKMADPSCFDAFLNVIFALILVEKGGLVLDVLTIQEEEEGANIFAKMADDANAETPIKVSNPVIIKPRNNSFYIYNTSFRDEQIEKRANDRQTLRALYLLKQDNRHGLDAMERTAAAQELTRCASWFTNDHFLRDQISNTCSSLINSVPAYKFNF